MPSVPSVYFILGTPGSGRREIVRDLVENGLAAEERAVVLVAEGESAAPADGMLTARAATTVQRWSFTPPDLPDVALPAGAAVFFLADILADPLAQLEALKPWLGRHNVELARIFCVVDCQFVEKNDPLRPWYAAMVHFSDVIFLTRREGVANKWLSDFVRQFQDENCHPGLFIPLKKTGLPNPALVLDPTPRRLSLYFEENEDLSDVVIESEDEEDEAEDEDAILPEPYFERNRSGRRVKELPDIRNYLPVHG